MISLICESKKQNNEQTKQHRNRFINTRTNWWLPEGKGLGAGKTGEED